MAKRKRVRCQLVLNAKGKRLIRRKNPAKHRLTDGTPLCTVHWRMSAEGNRPVAEIMRIRTHSDMVVAKTLRE